MIKRWQRVLSGVLASLMVGQIFIFGDGNSQGIAHAETIEDISEYISQSDTNEELAGEYDELTEGFKNSGVTSACWSLGKSIYSRFTKED